MKASILSILCLPLIIAISTKAGWACAGCQATCPAMTCNSGFTPQVQSDTCKVAYEKIGSVKVATGCEAGGTVSCRCQNSAGTPNGAAVAGTCQTVVVPCVRPYSLSHDPVLCN